MPARSVILLMGIGDGKPDKADRTLGVIHFLQQLLGQGEDDAERRQFLSLRQAAGDLLEVVELDFQGKGIAPEVRMATKSLHQFDGHMIQEMSRSSVRSQPMDLRTRTASTGRRSMPRAKS